MRSIGAQKSAPSTSAAYTAEKKAKKVWELQFSPWQKQRMDGMALLMMVTQQHLKSSMPAKKHWPVLYFIWTRAKNRCQYNSDKLIIINPVFFKRQILLPFFAHVFFTGPISPYNVQTTTKYQSSFNMLNQNIYISPKTSKQDESQRNLQKGEAAAAISNQRYTVQKMGSQKDCNFGWIWG